MGCRSAWRHEERASAAAAPRGREWRACWAREWRRLHRDGFNISICRVTRPHIGQENVTQVWSTIVTGKSLWKFSKYTPLQILLCWQQENNQLEKHEVAKADSWLVCLNFSLPRLACLCLGSTWPYWAIPGLTGLCWDLLGLAWACLAITGLTGRYQAILIWSFLTLKWLFWICTLTDWRTYITTFWDAFAAKKISFKYFEYFHNIFNILHHVSDHFFKTLQCNEP